MHDACGDPMKKWFPIAIIGAGLLTLGIWQLTKPSEQANDYAKTCGHELREKLCFVDINGVAECDLSEPRFDVLEQKLLAVFTAAPEQVKQKLCSIGAISVNYPTNGVEPWMGAFTNGKVIGLNMFKWRNIGIPFENWEHSRLVWFPSEQGHGHRIADSEKIKVRFTKDSPFQIGLNYTIATDIFHEVGHLIEHDLMENPFKCLYENGLENSLNEMPLAPGNANAYCKTYIEPTQDIALLTRLQNSEFASLYATCSPQEDFAEAYAQYIMSNHLGRKIIASKDNADVYVQTEHLKSPTLAKKFEIIAHVLKHNTNDQAERARLRLELHQCSGPFAAS